MTRLVGRGSSARAARSSAGVWTTSGSLAGTKKSVGVILPASLTFNTGAPEIMEGVAGTCRVRLKGQADWKTYGAGESFDVPGNSSFDIEVAGEPYHYICHFG